MLDSPSLSGLLNSGHGRMEQTTSGVVGPWTRRAGRPRGRDTSCPVTNGGAAARYGCLDAGSRHHINPYQKPVQR